MTKKNLKKWVTALRSGNYLQGDCALVRVKQFDEFYRYPCFCPLGVYAHKVQNVSVPSMGGEAFIDSADEIPDGAQQAIAAMNDNLELDFKAIAFIIEHHFSDLVRFGRVDKKGKYDVDATAKALRGWAPVRKALAAKKAV